MSDEQHEEHIENVPTMEEFPDFVQTDNAIIVRVNSTRLETYLKAIKTKLRNHDTSLLNQVEALDRSSKADEIRISKLAVRLDHCLQDVHNFKDLVLGKLRSDKDGVGERNLYSHEITYLQSQVTSLSAMMRKIELSQSEGLESFCQIKQLNESLKTVMRQLDSLGKNSVILELRQHFDKIINLLRLDIKFITDKQANMELETKERVQKLEEESLSALDQRIALLEEKSALYDMILNEQEPEGEDEGDTTENAGRVDNEQEEEGVVKSDTVMVVDRSDVPLRPSQMMLLEQPDQGSEDEGSPSREEESPGRRQDQLSELGGPRASALQLIHNLAPSPGFRALRSASAMIRPAHDSNAPYSEIIQNITATLPENNQPFIATTISSKNGTTRGSITSKNGTTRGSITTKNGTTRGSILKQSSFFNNLMGQYVNQQDFTETIQDIKSYTHKSIYRLKQQIITHAVYLLFTSFTRIYKSLLHYKYKKSFYLLKNNVQIWNNIRNRRNYTRATKFQTKMQYLCSRHIKKFGFQYWARMTYLFNERDRLKLWLRNVLQHWINMRAINIKIYMNRWKKSTIHSYYSSLFVEDENTMETSGKDTVRYRLASLILLLYYTCADTVRYRLASLVLLLYYYCTKLLLFC